MRILFYLIFLFSYCSKNPAEKEIKKAISSGDFLTAARFCAEYKETNLEKECAEQKEKSVDEINRILSEKQNLPFTKLIVDRELSRKVRELLKKDIKLGIQYRQIWEETVEKR